MKANDPVAILMVDNKTENLLVLESILNSDNYSLIKVNSGKEALETLSRGVSLAIILMETQMPSMDGFETAGLIRRNENYKNVPIIFLGNLNHPEDALKAYRHGIVDHISRPFPVEILKTKVNVFLQLYHKNLELIEQKETMTRMNEKWEEQVQSQKKIESKLIKAKKMRKKQNKLQRTL